jgi:hypothetical protein
MEGMGMTEKPHKFTGEEAPNGALQLGFPSGMPCALFLCSTCGTAFKSKDCAEKCCACMHCGLPCPGERNHSLCSSAYRDKRDSEILDKAELVEWDGCAIYFNEHVYYDLEELIGEIEGDGGEVPEFIFATKTQPFFLNIDHALESACEDGYEDIAEHLEGVDELRAAVAKFNDRNKERVSLFEDPKRKIRLRRSDDLSEFYDGPEPVEEQQA